MSRRERLWQLLALKEERAAAQLRRQHTELTQRCTQVSARQDYLNGVLGEYATRDGLADHAYSLRVDSLRAQLQREATQLALQASAVQTKVRAHDLALQRYQRLEERARETQDRVASQQEARRLDQQSTTLHNHRSGRR